jgi:hypothetical protein
MINETLMSLKNRRTSEKDKPEQIKTKNEALWEQECTLPRGQSTAVRDGCGAVCGVCREKLSKRNAAVMGAIGPYYGRTHDSFLFGGQNKSGTLEMRALC